MQQARQAFECGLLSAQTTDQLGLVAALLLDAGPHESGDPFSLMPRCPGEYIRAILRQASSLRVLVRHHTRLSRVQTRDYSPIYEMCPDIR
jgi:hypothetical protein